MDEPFEVDRQTEIIRKQIEEDMEGKWSPCDNCWGWSPEICGANCPDYQSSSGKVKKDD